MKGVGQLPDFGDMDLLKGRTYRYYNATKFGAPLVYQFGDGLSYSTFKCERAAAFLLCLYCLPYPRQVPYLAVLPRYSDIRISRAESPSGTGVRQRACSPVTVNVTLTNTGRVPAREVAQLYISIGNGAAINLPPAPTGKAAAGSPPPPPPPGPSPCWPNCAGPQANPFTVTRPNAEMRGAS